MTYKTQEEIKILLGKQAADLVEEGMIVGLGTGSTANCFIKSLGRRCQEGLQITAVSSSQRSLELAKEEGIPCVDINTLTSIDLTVHGADEVDPFFRMIKGGGGAHVREKIVATMSKKMVVIVDESKLVQALGKCGLPVEILPFAATSTIYHLNQKGFRGKMRARLTDNGNCIYDIHDPLYFKEPEKAHVAIKEVCGVVDTGFFFNLATSVLVGYKGGKLEFLAKDEI